MRIEPWPRGYCEAGNPALSFGRFRSCGRRGRWMVNDTILCGSCKRKAEKAERSSK